MLNPSPNMIKTFIFQRQSEINAIMRAATNLTYTEREILHLVIAGIMHHAAGREGLQHPLNAFNIGIDAASAA